MYNVDTILTSLMTTRTWHELHRGRNQILRGLINIDSISTPRGLGNFLVQKSWKNGFMLLITLRAEWLRKTCVGPVEVPEAAKTASGDSAWTVYVVIALGSFCHDLAGYSRRRPSINQRHEFALLNACLLCGISRRRLFFPGHYWR